MAPRYYSKEWVEQGVQNANSDEVYLKKAAKFNIKTWTGITDDPDGNDISVKWTYENGKVANYEYEAAPAPSGNRIGNPNWYKLRGNPLRLLGMHTELDSRQGRLFKICL